MARTNSYCFTVDMANGKPFGPNARKLEELRASVKFCNSKRHTGNPLYVKLQGRIGIDNPNAWKYKRGGIRFMTYQCIRLPDAQTADVYIYERRP